MISQTAKKMLLRKESPRVRQVLHRNRHITPTLPFLALRPATFYEGILRDRITAPPYHNGEGSGQREKVIDNAKVLYTTCLVLDWCYLKCTYVLYIYIYICIYIYIYIYISLYTCARNHSITVFSQGVQ